MQFQLEDLSHFNYSFAFVLVFLFPPPSLDYLRITEIVQ